MKDHYGFSDSQMAILAKANIGISELFHAVKHFQVGQTDQSPISKVSLLRFIDTHGDFTERENSLQLIAYSCFQNLTPKEQKEVMGYIMLSEQFCEDDDEDMPTLEDD